MTVHDAIAHLGADHVEHLLADTTREFAAMCHGRALDAWMANTLVTQAAYGTLECGGELNVRIVLREMQRTAA